VEAARERLIDRPILQPRSDSPAPASRGAPGAAGASLPAPGRVASAPRRVDAALGHARDGAAREPPPLPSDADGAAEPPVFEHTLRGLTRQQLTQLAGPRPDSAPLVKTRSAAPAAPPPLPAAMPAEPPALDPIPSSVGAPITTSVVRPLATTSRFFPQTSVLALILLFQAFALPTAAGPPWELFTRPAEVTLQAFAALILVGVVHLLRCRETTRSRLGVALGLLLMPFVIVAARATVVGGAFDAQPALEGLFGQASVWPGILAVPALALLPAGLFARRRAPLAWAAGVFGAGLFALGLCAALMPTGGLFAALREATFLGDRIAAWATVPLLVLLVASPAGVLVPSLARGTKALGFAIWAAALLPLVVLALFSAKSDQWTHVLEPLKLVSFLAAVTIYLAAALATAVHRKGAAP
jgi:hypothetical protein